VVLPISQLADDLGNGLGVAAVNMHAPVRLAGLLDRGPAAPLGALGT
jgi:hypothetical protein